MNMMPGNEVPFLREHEIMADDLVNEMEVKDGLAPVDLTHAFFYLMVI